METDGWEKVKEIFVMLRFLVKIVGAERIALSTDYPLPLGELELGRLIESMPFDSETKAILLHNAPLEWLNLDKNLFI